MNSRNEPASERWRSTRIAFTGWKQENEHLNVSCMLPRFNPFDDIFRHFLYLNRNNTFSG
jgi:hypothetical protein